MFAARIDHKERLFRRYNKSLEFIWANTGVFTIIAPYHYDIPEGLRFDLKKQIRVIDDSESVFYNLRKMTEWFENIVNNHL